MNLLDGRVDGDTLVCGPFVLPKPTGLLPERVVVGVRPEDVHIVESGGVEFDVVVAERLGAETHFLLRAGEVEVRARAPGFDSRTPGSRVRLSLEGAKLHVFEPTDDGRRLA
jgi:multiple sugar transport system ATP-binding protein